MHGKAGLLQLHYHLKTRQLVAICQWTWGAAQRIQLLEASTCLALCLHRAFGCATAVGAAGCLRCCCCWCTLHLAALLGDAAAVRLHVQAGRHERQLLQCLSWQPFADSTSNTSQRTVRLVGTTERKQHSSMVLEQA
jgi:hypothetical protein